VDTVAGASRADLSQPLAHRLTRIAIWIGAVALFVFVLDLLGVPAGDWIRDLLRKVGDVPPWAIVAGVVLETAQDLAGGAGLVRNPARRPPHARVPYRLGWPATPSRSRSTASCPRTSAPG